MSLLRFVSNIAILHYVTLFFFVSSSQLIDPLSALQNDTFVVPYDFVKSFFKYDDEHKLDLPGARLVKVDLGPQKHHHQVSTDFSLGGFVFKWASIVFIVMTPLALFPLLFLFVRSQPKMIEEDETDDDSNSPSTGAGQKQQLKNLKRVIHLWPTDAHLDPYLSKLAKVEGNIVQVNASTGESYYHLDLSVSMQNWVNGQLYHPPSGIVFVPIHEYIYQPGAGLYVDILNGEFSSPQANHVYSRETNKLYERCLGLGYNMTSSTFYIPPQPVAQEKQATAVRRLLPEELTDSYRPKYIELLEKEQSNKLNEFVKPDNESNQKYLSLPSVEM